MASAEQVLEYKCPCCGAGLIFNNASQKLSCQYCDNEFDLETVRQYNESINKKDETAFAWENEAPLEWTAKEQETLRTFNCSSCGGVLLTDAQTAATFCPYCENPTILPGRLTGGIKPDAVIPFRTGKNDAQNAFRALCKGKALLPKEFAQESRLEKITGMYVPFWLYNCKGTLDGKYNATRIHHWSDSKYNYTKTEHFLLSRIADGDFSGIPMDASSKLDNAIMESIEPFDYSQMVDFDTAYLSGYLADKYDVESKFGEERIRQRVSSTMDEMLKPTFTGFSTVVPNNRQIQVRHSSAKYVLLPVWMLHTRYKDKLYVFAMNGQTGKMTGTFPICPKKSAAWFAAVCAGVTLLVTAFQFLGF